MCQSCYIIGPIYTYLDIFENKYFPLRFGLYWRVFFQNFASCEHVKLSVWEAMASFPQFMHTYSCVCNEHAQDTVTKMADYRLFDEH